MATTVVALRWLDRLEQEFDKSFTDLDALLGQLDDEDELLEQAREKMGTLSSSFAQLCHKAQTIFHNNAKLEAQLVDMRTDLCQAKAELQHFVQKTVVLSNCGSSASTPVISGAASQDDHLGTAPAPQQLAADVETDSNQASCRLTAQALYCQELVGQLERENRELRQYVLALQGEVYGARLAAKYLDKELAGRIQQIQLLGRNMNTWDKEKLWNQLEAEIQLHRHKTVIRACQGRKLDSSPAAVAASSEAMPRKRKTAEQPRTVVLHRDPVSGLGLSVTGGSEHGVPVLISDIKPGSVAAAGGQLRVGDAILSVNGIPLSDVRHAEAVDLLSKQYGELKLEVAYLEPDPDSDDEDGTIEDESGFRYRVYDQTLSQITAGGSTASQEQTNPLLGTAATAASAASSVHGDGSAMRQQDRASGPTSVRLPTPAISECPVTAFAAPTPGSRTGAPSVGSLPFTTVHSVGSRVSGDDSTSSPTSATVDGSSGSQQCIQLPGVNIKK